MAKQFNVDYLVEELLHNCKTYVRTETTNLVFLEIIL